MSFPILISCRFYNNIINMNCKLLHVTVNCLIKRLNMTNDSKPIYSRVTNHFQFQ